MYRVFKHDVRFTSLNTILNQFHPQSLCRHCLCNFARVRINQFPGIVKVFVHCSTFDQFHKAVGHYHTVMQVYRLAIYVTACRLANVQKLFNLGVRHMQVCCIASAACHALRECKHFSIHDFHKGNHTRTFGAIARFRANTPDPAPAPANASTNGGKKSILYIVVSDTSTAIVSIVQKATDRQTALRSTIGKNRSREHKPKLASVVIQTLSMGFIICKRHSSTSKGILRRIFSFN